jgi:hypothetical protein
MHIIIKAFKIKITKIIYIKRITFIENKTKIAFYIIEIKLIILNSFIDKIISISNIKFKIFI